ncbi:hypothetical protein O181_029710 [Austropuccinia psidii MF-1]|uniref:Reverse transcriptase RNase H-like domain-containing protein n=1 Tax=Austropuccinia psidii MF-1 TaxID=1389203 RepID=A0A9Q3CVQ3_9BASI|nr:hypothetical protein [Austropuccinia psidii MF-1]
MEFVPSAYHHYLSLLSKVKEEKLPPHLEGSLPLPSVGVIFPLSNQESDTLRTYISENVEKGFFWPSSSSTGEHDLFVKKKDVVPHLCVDYHKLNAVTRKKKYPVPPINQILTDFNESYIFYEIYFCSAYNLLRIKESDENLPSFRTKHGNFYVAAYLDAIMVFHKSEEEHFTHVSTVLARLRGNNLFSKVFKFLFHVSSVEYLGYAVSSEGLKMDQEKSRIFSTCLLKEASRLFNHSLVLKTSTAVSAIIIQRILVHSQNSSRKIHVHPSMKKLSESLINSKRLSPLLPSFSTHHWKPPITFDNCKLLPEELTYEIHQKKLLAIFRALKCWRDFLLSLSSPFEFLTNHSSLKYFMSSKILTLCQAHWAGFLSEFHFSITYFPGPLEALPDVSSHQENASPEWGNDLIRKNGMNYQQIIKQDEIQASKLFSGKVESFSNVIELIQK